MSFSNFTRFTYLNVVVVITMLLQLFAAKVCAQDFSTYVWTEYQPVDPSQIPADLKQMLIGHINEMVRDRDSDGSDDHLAPMYVSRGISSDHGETYWGAEVTISPGEWFFVNPGELVYSLSLAYPYLDQTTQTKVIDYLASEMQGYPPAGTNGEWGWYSEYLLEGVRRELHDIPTPNVWPALEPPIENLYALWLYANNTGDWQYISDNWSDIVNVYDSFGSADTYAEIGGLIGMARLAQHEGQTTLADQAANKAIQGMQAGLNFHNFRNKFPRGMHFNDEPVFNSLVPEVGRYLKENVPDAQNYVNDVTSKTQKQQWWQTRVFRHGYEDDEPFGGENEYFSPYVSWPIFLAKAYVFEENQSVLKEYIDIPWCEGDLYYIQKLVATIEATASSDSTPPEISDVTVANVTFHSAMIRWQTDEPASSQVEYGLTTDYQSQSPVQVGGVTYHGITLTGLRSSTSYHFRACSTSPGGRSCSLDYTFTTAEGFEVFLPLILKKFPIALVRQ